MTLPSTLPSADGSSKIHTLWSVSTSLVASPTPEELRAFYPAACEAGAPAVELGRNTPDDSSGRRWVLVEWQPYASVSVLPPTSLQARRP